MPVISVTTRDGRTTEVAAVTGRSMMQVLRDAGIDEIQAVCGGSASCSTCHVYVADEHMSLLQPLTADEDALLECSDCRLPTSRLSCQIDVTDALDGLRVRVAPEA